MKNQYQNNSSTDNIIKHFTATMSWLIICAMIIMPLSLSTGCSKQKPKVRKVKVSIRSTPDKVDVIAISHRNDKFGVTPKTGSLRPGVYVLEFSKPGYKTTWKKLTCKQGKNEDFEIKLEPITASVIIETQPVGATVSKDDKPLGETPLAIHGLPLGIHNYTLDKPGFSTREVRFSLEDERPRLIEQNMNSNIGKMVVRSTPSNASIFINDAPRGQTPATLTMEQGEYKIKLDLNGYIIQEEKVIVSKGGTARVNAKLQVKPASIKIVSTPPGATLLVNGKQYNNTPTTLKHLKPGTYAIHLSHPKYDTAKREVSVNPGQNLTVNIKLDSNMGGIDLIIHPPGVTIYVDGKKMGVTERGETDELSKIFQVRGLPSGTHTITVAHKRAVPLEKKFKIKIKKGKISRPKPLTFWIKDTYLKLKTGEELTGRISQENENEIHFEHTPKITIRYGRDEIETIKKLQDKE